MVPVYGQVAQPFARTSHVDFETRYDRTRVMTSRAFAAARFSVGDFLLSPPSAPGCANGSAVVLRQKK